MITVINVFLQKEVGETGIAKQDGLGEVNSARSFDLLYQKVISLFRSSGFPEDLDLSSVKTNDGLDCQ